MADGETSTASDWSRQRARFRLLDTKIVRRLGIPMATPDARARRGAMVALRCHDAPALVTALHAAGIVTGNLRLSPHFYNDDADVDAYSPRSKPIAAWRFDGNAMLTETT